MGQNHLQVALNMSLHVTAIYDVNQESLNAISKKLDSSTLLTSNLDEFMNLPKTDLTTIATTSPSHAELIDSLASNGRRLIICEKPLATSTSELKQISELVKIHGLKIAVNHQMRFMDQYRLVKNYQQEYQLGKLCSMNVNGANFGLGMNATHYIEAFHWLSSAEISSVSGKVTKQKQPNVRGSEFYDYAGYMLVQADTGSVLFLDFQEKISHQVLVVYNFEFGKILVNELLGTLTINCRFAYDLDQPTFRYGLPNQHFEFRIKPAELIDSTTELYTSVINGTDYPTHLNGERAVRSAMAAIRSTELGGIPVSLNDSNFDQMDKLSWP